ncbi:MAG: hypothetical protein ACRDSJ_03580 [Rubrobacteraceae bacterium]
MLEPTKATDAISKPLPPGLFMDHRAVGLSDDYVNGPGYNAETRWEAMSGAGCLTPPTASSSATTPRRRASTRRSGNSASSGRFPLATMSC